MTLTALESEGIIRKIIQVVHSSLNLDDVFQKIADSLGQYLRADRCFIARYDSHIRKLLPPTREYRSSEEIESMVEADPTLWLALDSFAHTLCREAGPIEFNQLCQGISAEAQTLLGCIRVQAGLGCAISYQSNCLAILFIHQVQNPRIWTDIEKEIIQVVSCEAAVAIQQAESTQRLQIRAHRQELLTQLNRSALTGLSLEALFNHTLRLITENLKVNYTKIVELQPGPDPALIFRAVVGFDPTLLGQKFEPGIEPHAAYTLQALEPVVVVDINQETRFEPSPLHKQYKLISGVAVVIYGVEKPYGVLEADSEHKRYFEPDDIDFLQALANFLGVVLERKQAETKARDLQERFQLMIEGVKDYAIYRMDTEGYISSWNIGAERRLGYVAEEIIGQHFSVFFIAEDIQSRKPWHLLETAVLKGQVNDEALRKRKNGTPFMADVLITSIVNAEGTLLGFSNIAQDVTARKNAEARNQALLNTSLDAIVMIDQNSRIMVWNPAAEQIFGYSQGQALGQSMASLIIPKRFREPHLHGMQQYLATGEGPAMGKHLELSAIRADGSEFPVELTITRVQLAGPPLFMGTLRDITQRKLAEEALLQSQAKLERSNQDLTQFAAIASHDLRAPLRKVKTFFGLIQEKAKGKLDLETLDLMDRVEGSIDDMAGLIADLLDLSKLSNETSPLQSVKLVEVMHQVLQNLEVTIQETGAEVHVGPLPSVLGNDTLLVQLMQNLLENALKYQPPGQKPFVQIEGEQFNNQLCQLKVTDNGIGFQQAYAHLVFQPFKRLHGKSSPYPGTGVGLAICERIVQRHNGTIDVQSEEGRGTTFLINLPSVETPLINVGLL